jgi:hypothetical protein
MNWWSMKPGPQRQAAKDAEEIRLAERPTIDLDKRREAEARLEQCFYAWPAGRKIRPRIRATMPQGDDFFLIVHLGCRHVPLGRPEDFRRVIKSIYSQRVRRLREHRNKPPASAEGK